MYLFGVRRRRPGAADVKVPKKVFKIQFLVTKRCQNWQRLNFEIWYFCLLSGANTGRYFFVWSTPLGFESEPQGVFSSRSKNVFFCLWGKTVRNFYKGGLPEQSSMHPVLSATLVFSNKIKCLPSPVKLRNVFFLNIRFWYKSQFSKSRNATKRTGGTAEKSWPANDKTEICQLMWWKPKK